LASLQNYVIKYCHIRGNADNSLARPGRKQATATKFGIYSTFTTRSSIACVSKICKLLKKFRILSFQPGLRGSNDPRVVRKVVTC